MRKLNEQLIDVVLISFNTVDVILFPIENMWNVWNVTNPFECNFLDWKKGEIREIQIGNCCDILCNIDVTMQFFSDSEESFKIRKMVILKNKNQLTKKKEKKSD